MAEPTAHLVDQHLSTVGDVIRALISDDRLNREAFRAAVRSGYRCLMEAESGLRHCSLDDASYLVPIIQLAATAYRAAWSSA